MNRTLICSLFLAVAFSPCVTAQVPEENAARTAEQSGRFGEALAQYGAALQKSAEGSADELRIREAAIRIAARLVPKPDISTEARRFFVRGQTAFKDAKGPADLEEAAREFGRATRVSPWWSDAYFNQGVAWEKANKLAEAIASFKLYVLAAAGSPDAQKVNDQIFALEYRLERSQKEGAAATQEQERKRMEQAARMNDPGRIAGEWCDLSSDGRKSCPSRFQYISVRGHAVEIRGVWVEAAHRVLVRGTVQGSAIKGVFIDGHPFPHLCPNRSEFPFEAIISADASRVNYEFTRAARTRAKPCQILETARDSGTLVRP